MKKLVATMLALLMVLISVGIAEEVPFSEWIAGQDPVVADVFAEEAPAPEAPMPEAPAFVPIGVGSRGETVAQLQTKLIELGILDSKADGVFGPASEEAVKYTQKALGWEETGVIQTADELNTILALVPGDGVNLAVGTSDEWSEWMVPKYDVDNYCFTIGYAYLEDLKVGEPFTCQIEIEFTGVEATEGSDEEKFAFYTQGAVDDDWYRLNVWNRQLIDLNQTPIDGVYKYSSTVCMDEKSTMCKYFDVGFRCNYWKSGSFRVRNVKVEKGITATPWRLAERDFGNGTNLFDATTENWSEWIAPQYDTNNSCSVIGFIDLDNKHEGDSYTCQLEIEFADVSVNVEHAEEFRFYSQGAIDEKWKWGNIWNPDLVYLTTPPSDGIYKFEVTSKINRNAAEATRFDLGFRCDFWASGMFRIRKVKIENGVVPTEWTME